MKGHQAFPTQAENSRRYADFKAAGPHAAQQQHVVFPSQTLANTPLKGWCVQTGDSLGGPGF